MKIDITKEWLLRVLEFSDDSLAGAGGSTLEEFKKKVEERTVTPAILFGIPTELGRVVRFKREELGLTRADLAHDARLDEREIVLIESDADFQPSPRTISFLAQALGLSSDRLKRLANHVIVVPMDDGSTTSLPFAAKSSGTAVVTDEEFEAIRVLAGVLSEKADC